MLLTDMTLHQELFLSAMAKTKENVKSILFLRLMVLTSLKLFKKLLRPEFTKRKKVRKKRKRRNQNLHLKLHHPKRWLLTRKKDGVPVQPKTGLKKSQLRSQFAMETN
jgi:hypothetical protein